MALSNRRLGDALADRLGIEVRAPHPAPPPANAPTPAAGVEALADFVGIDPERLDGRAKPTGQAGGPQSGIDSALSIADRVAAGAQLSDEDCSFLWSDPRFIPAFQKRLDLERAIAKGKRA